MAQKRTSNQSKLRQAERLLRQLDAQTARAAKTLTDDNWRDNLFEIVMARFDIMARKREDYARIPALLIDHPAAAPDFLRRFAGALHGMLAQAGAPEGPLAVVAFAGVYLAAAQAFFSDESKDLGKTMAALDRNLGVFERVVRKKCV